MKKTLLIGAVLLVLVLVLGVAGIVYAQTQTPPFDQPGFGRGMMGGNGFGMMGRGTGMGSGMMGRGGYGPVHTYMVEVFAEQVGLTVDEVNDRLANGDSMWDIAQDQGFTGEEVQDLMVKVHNEALEKAVAGGVLTQEQAEWMKQHMSQRLENGFGPGSCHGGGGMMGGGSWRQPAPEA